MKKRMLRVVQLVQQELSAIIQKDLEFPGVIVCVNSVEVTPDLRHANVFVGIVGSEKGQENAMRTLNNKRVHLQKRLAGRIILHQTPQLHFNLDSSVVRGVHITNILTKIDQEIGADAWKDLSPEDLEGKVPMTKMK